MRVRSMSVAAWGAAVWVGLMAAAPLLAQTGRNVERGTPESNARRALVVGNAAYESGKLKNPVSDATDMKALLEELGFEVERVLDADKRAMIESIRAFGRRLRRGGLGLFYYAGHGVQVDGVNYLIPIGAEIEKESDIEFEAVSLRRLLNEMGEAQNGVNVVVLDACRDNPFRTFRTLRRGLAQTKAPAGTFIAYATAPDAVADDGGGRNGVFTSHLLGSLREPGLEIELAFKKARESVMAATGGKQVPWTASSLIGNLMLAERPPSPSPPPPPPPTDTEFEFWRRVEHSDDVAELEAYLRRYPDGAFSELALLRINKLKTVPPPPARTPPPPPPSTPRPGTEWEEEAVGMKFRYLPAGSFRMGSPKEEPERDDDETPHQVELTRGFWMGETEVTQEQWQSVMRNSPSTFKSCGKECPVETVSWFDAVTFANWLSEKAGFSECYDLKGCQGDPGTEGYTCQKVKLAALDCSGYRLPTEAEWEYATRAETTTPFWTGNNLTTEQANYDGNYPYAGNAKGEYRRKPIPVRSFGSNKWGLYEVHGNVWEWVWDWKGYYPTSLVRDPRGPQGGSSRVLRGGSWGYLARYCRGANRSADSPGNRSDDVGFRLVRMGS